MNVTFLWSAPLVVALKVGGVAVVLSTLCLLGMRFLQNRSAASRASLATAVLFTLALFPLAPVLLPSLRIPILPPLQQDEGFRPTVAAILPSASAPTSTDLSGEALAASPSAPMSTHKPIENDFLTSSIRWLPFLPFTIWGMGAAIKLAQVSFGFLGLRRLARGAHFINDPALLETFRSAQDRSGYRGPVRFLISDRVDIPITWGLFGPTILCPADATEWIPESIEAALLHELAHIRRRDYISHTLGKIACAIHWWNPPVTRLFESWKRDAELACDDIVLGHGYSGEEYGSILLGVLEHAQTLKPEGSLGLAMVRQSTLEARLASMLDPVRRRKSLPQRGQWLLALLMFAITGLLVAAEPTPASSKEKTTAPTSTERKLSPELRTHLEGIIRECKRQESFRSLLRFHVEYAQNYWNVETGQYLNQPEPTKADVTLDLSTDSERHPRYNVIYNPLVMGWSKDGDSPITRFNKHQSQEITDGEQTWTYYDFKDRSAPVPPSHQLQSGDLGYLAAYRYRADSQALFSASDLLNGTKAVNAPDYAVDVVILDGKPAVRLQRELPQGYGMQRQQWWFDPQRQYVLVQYKWEGIDTKRQHTTSTFVRVTKLEEVAPGIHYPAAFTTDQRTEEQGKLANRSFIAEGKFTNFEVLKEVPPNYFTVAGAAALTAPSADAETPLDPSVGPNAEVLIQGVRNLYAKYKTFSCTGEFLSKDGRGMEKRTFTIRFARPDKIRVSWTEKALMGNGTTESVIYTEKGKIRNKSGIIGWDKESPSIESAIGEDAGISRGISYSIPSLLLGKSGYYDYWKLDRLPDQTVDGQDCYVVRMETKGYGFTTFYLSKSKQLAIIRTVEDFDAKVVDAQRERAHKENPAWFNDSGVVTKVHNSSQTTLDYHNVQINTPLAEEDFALKIKPAETVTITPTLVTTPVRLAGLEDLKKADQLAKDGKYAEALEQYRWFHEASKKSPGMGGVRRSFALGRWKDLGDKYPPAREALVALRDQYESALRTGRGTKDNYADLASIDHYLGQEDKAVALFLDLDHTNPDLAKSAYYFARDLLLKAKQYTLLSRYLPDAEEDFKRIADSRQRMIAYEKAHPNSAINKADTDNTYVNDILFLVEVLVGADRIDDAKKVQALAMKELSDARITTAVADAKKRIKL